MHQSHRSLATNIRKSCNKFTIIQRSYTNRWQVIHTAYANHTQVILTHTKDIQNHRRIIQRIIIQPYTKVIHKSSTSHPHIIQQSHTKPFTSLYDSPENNTQQQKTIQNIRMSYTSHAQVIHTHTHNPSKSHTCHAQVIHHRTLNYKTKLYTDHAQTINTSYASNAHTCENSWTSHTHKSFNAIHKPCNKHTTCIHKSYGHIH